MANRGERLAPFWLKLSPATAPRSTPSPKHPILDGAKTMKTKMRSAAALLCTGLVPFAAEPPSAATRQYWEDNCAMCHGTNGRADTKAGRKMGAIDFTDPKNQARFTDEQMFRTIKDGVKDKAGKYTMKPAENATDEQIKALVALVRSFKK